MTEKELFSDHFSNYSKHPTRNQGIIRPKNFAPDLDSSVPHISSYNSTLASFMHESMKVKVVNENLSPQSSLSLDPVEPTPHIQ